MSEHVVVWIDHEQAKVIHLDGARGDGLTVHAPRANTHHKHPRGAEGAHDHPNDQARFFREVAGALRGDLAVLLVGPSSAKHELVHWLEAHTPALARSIVHVETIDHPTTGELVAHAKAYFAISATRGRA